MSDEQKPRPAAKPAGPGTLLLAREGGVVPLTPEGKEGDEFGPEYGGLPVRIVHRTAPNPKTSDRSSIFAVSPPACSGEI